MVLLARVASVTQHVQQRRPSAGVGGYLTLRWGNGAHEDEAARMLDGGPNHALAVRVEGEDKESTPPGFSTVVAWRTSDLRH